MCRLLPRIPQMDWAGRTGGRGNAGETAGSFFHPSGPSELGHLIQRKSLTYRSKLARGAGRTPFHPVNPGLRRSDLRPLSTKWANTENSCLSRHILRRAYRVSNIAVSQTL